MQADAATVFDRLFTGQAAQAVEVGCLAHGRRKLIALQEMDCRVAYPLKLLARVYRIEQKRRESAIAHGRGDDLPRKWKQKPRAFDQQHRLEMFLRHVLDAEHAREFKFECEQNGPGALGAAFELQRHLIIGDCKLRDPDIDLDLNLRLGCSGGK